MVKSTQNLLILAKKQYLIIILCVYHSIQYLTINNIDSWLSILTYTYVSIKSYDHCITRDSISIRNTSIVGKIKEGNFQLKPIKGAGRYNYIVRKLNLGSEKCTKHTHHVQRASTEVYGGMPLGNSALKALLTKSVRKTKPTYTLNYVAVQKNKWK